MTADQVRRPYLRWMVVGLPLLLLALLAVLWLRPASPLRGSAWAPPAAQPPQLNDFQLAMLQAGAAQAAAASGEVLQRPLFTPGRRPAPVALPASGAHAAPAPDPMANVKATGLLVSPALTAVMLEVDGQQKLVRRGDRLGDWRLVSIRGREAVFVRDGERHVVSLPHAHTPVPAPAKPASAPSGGVRLR